MELLQQLFLTALLAVFFSFLIAKLVSAASAGGDSSRDSHVPNSQNVDHQKIAGECTQVLQYRERLQVERFESKKKVEFDDQGAQLVDKFSEGPAEIEGVEKSVEKNEVIGAECCEFPPQSTGDVLKEDKELLDDISGNNGEELQVNAKLPDDSSSFQQTEEVADDLLVENTKTETDISPEKDVTEKSEENRTVESEAKEKADEKKIEIDSDDDDWEGIEKSELENIFAKATEFVESGDKDEDLTSEGSHLQMQLYGLHKVATEGPCREQPPMALKVAARAKWNAWQRLGNMSLDVAMEQYIALVSHKFPGWMKDKSTGDGKLGSSEAANIGNVASDISTSSSHDPNIAEERNADVMPSTEKNDWTGGSILESRAKE